MTVPFDFRRGARREPVLSQTDAMPAVDPQASHFPRPGDGAEIREAWRPRVQADPIGEHHDHFRREVRTGPDPVAGARPYPGDDWSRREDLNAVERLAAMLEARQLERDGRLTNEASSQPREDNIAEFEEVEPEQDLGERFGWGDRWSGEDVRGHLEDHREPVARRWIGPLARAGAVLGVSAAIAYFIVYPGGAMNPADEPSAAVESPAEEQIAAGGDDAPIAAAPSNNTAARPSEVSTSPVPATPEGPVGERSAFAPGASADASPPAVQPVDRDNIRMIMPAPHQVTGDSVAGAPSQAAVAPEQADSGETAPLLRSRDDAGPSWIAPAPTAEERSEAVEIAVAEQPASEAVAAAEPERLAAARPAGVTQAVNMRAEPENDGAVLTIIPADATVDLIACDGWCEVVYEGQRGWVYQSFVAGAN